jgi:hypothetical protein
MLIGLFIKMCNSACCSTFEPLLDPASMTLAMANKNMSHSDMNFTNINILSRREMERDFYTEFFSHARYREMNCKSSRE